MNVQKIFQALKGNPESSALGKICEELERQGYIIAIDGDQVTSDELFNGNHEEIEKKNGPFDITLMITTRMQKLKIEQTFCIEFTDDNELIIKQKQA